jgi:hypothetical protein
MFRRAVSHFISNDFLSNSLSYVSITLAAFFLSLIANGYVQAGVDASPSALLQEQNGREFIPLELGKPVERELAEGQEHTYQIMLAEGQYVRVEIRQLGMEVRVSLQQPDGKTILVRDMFVRNPQIAFERVAESSGTYRLDVYARTKAPTGRYEIRVAELRPATEDEHALQQARKSSEEFMQLQRGGKYVESRPFLIRALEIRERVLGPEDLEVAETLEHLANNYELTGELRERGAAGPACSKD